MRAPQKTVYMGTESSMPYLRQGKPANSFRALRKTVQAEAGFDFLAKCDLLRPLNYVSKNPGVRHRSRHKTGDSFDYDRNDKRVVVVSEPQGTAQYFRTWIRCEKQDGSQGVPFPFPTGQQLVDIRGREHTGYYYDFTAAAERLGWQRIQAWRGWQDSYELMEFWHYQCTEGLSFDEAMEFLYSGVGRSTTVNDIRKPAHYRILGLNDRGSAVRNLQDKLAKLKKNGKPYLARIEVDGVFGVPTQFAAKRLQEDHTLDGDGLIGPLTRNLIDALL